MPKVTLRTTDEQHHDLVTAAKRNHRSLNNEILHRCFPPGQTGASPPSGVRIHDDGTHEIALTSEESEAWRQHFKPDPKPPAAEKKKRR